MSDLIKYVTDHTERGECKCGQCIDVGNKPDPKGHVADLMFFKVSKKGGATADEFKRLTKEHRGEFNKCDPFDGKEHSFIELGGWIGDQALAMQYMGLGTLLEVFDLLTPKTVLPPGIPDELMMEMAGSGMVTVKLKREKP
jgi:hypothetical protein